MARKEDPIKVIILAGPSGAGKSTYEQLVRDTNQHVPVVTCSADKHFVGADGVYRFDPRQLPAAHAKCLRDFTHAVTGGVGQNGVVVVDNTNTTAIELAPYLALANAYEADVEVHVFGLDTPTEELARRNTHGVPQGTCARMQDNLRATLKAWPPWWPKPTAHGGAQ